MKINEKAFERVVEELRVRKRREQICSSSGHVGAYEKGVNYRKWAMEMYCPRCDVTFYRALTREEVGDERERFNTPMRV